jgi:hypothetical protein
VIRRSVSAYLIWGKKQADKKLSTKEGRTGVTVDENLRTKYKYKLVLGAILGHLVIILLRQRLPIHKSFTRILSSLE